MKNLFIGKKEMVNRKETIISFLGEQRKVIEKSTKYIESEPYAVLHDTEMVVGDYFNGDKIEKIDWILDDKEPLKLTKIYYTSRIIELDPIEKLNEQIKDLKKTLQEKDQLIGKMIPAFQEGKIRGVFSLQQDIQKDKQLQEKDKKIKELFDKWYFTNLENERLKAEILTLKGGKR